MRTAVTRTHKLHECMLPADRRKGFAPLAEWQRGIISPPCAANRPQVQDTLDPEYYLGAARLPDGSWATTKFSDAALAARPPAEEDMKVKLVDLQGFSSGVREQGIKASIGHEAPCSGFRASCLPARSQMRLRHLVTHKGDGTMLCCCCCARPADRNAMNRRGISQGQYRVGFSIISFI
jgi:hypothetical protein